MTSLEESNGKNTGLPNNGRIPEGAEPRRRLEVPRYIPTVESVLFVKCPYCRGDIHHGSFCTVCAVLVYQSFMYPISVLLYMINLITERGAAASSARGYTGWHCGAQVIFYLRP